MQLAVLPTSKTGMGAWQHPEPLAGGQPLATVSDRGSARSATLPREVRRGLDLELARSLGGSSGRSHKFR